MSSRRYRMRQRADALQETRARIVRATMELHGEQGVAATSQADVAARAGVAPATVYRHFPTIGDLVRACGARVWATTSPPRAADAGRLFAGLDRAPQRLRRLVELVSDFYLRAEQPLQGARDDRRRVPELDADLRRIEADLEALARQAAAPRRPTAAQLRLVVALTDFGVWKALRDHGVPAAQIPSIVATLLDCALDQAHP